MQTKLRQYQIDVIQRIKELLNDGYNRFSLFMPAGAGLNFTIFSLIECLNKQYSIKNSIFIAQRNAILKQANEICIRFFYEISENVMFINQERVKHYIDELNMNICEKRPESDKPYLIILDDVSPLTRKKLNLLCRQSNVITVSISRGPYKYEVNRLEKNEVSILVMEDNKYKSHFDFEPGVYLCPTKEIIDIRDIMDSNKEEVLEINEYISKGLDFFVSIDDLNSKYVLQKNDKKKTDLEKRIRLLEKKEEELVSVIRKRGNLNE